MAPLGPDLTPVRRGVGVAAVLFLLSCAVLYLLAPGFPTSSASPSATASSSASPAPSTVGTQSATPGGPSSSAGPSRASEPRPPASTTTPAAGDGGPVSAEEKTIQVEDPADFAKPYQTVPIHGTYPGGAECLLRVQLWERHRWRAFPLVTRTDQSGQFTAYVELGQPGRYRLRVLDPDSGVTSKPFVLLIKR